MEKENTPGLEHVHLMVQESVLAKIVGIVLNAEQWSQTEADVRVLPNHNATVEQFHLVASRLAKNLW